jgi:threonine dehydratase
MRWMRSRDAAMIITLADIEGARSRIADQVERTPFERSQTLSALTGADVWLKFENHQFTASFKERGALNRLLLLPEKERRRGVIAMSAGNHAQAVAYHGRRLGIPTCILMPRFTPNAKVQQTRVFGAEVILHGENLDEARARAMELAEQRGLVLVHPYDDPAVIAGQGTLGLEMIDQVADLDTIVVPVGGGGLISGVALAVKSMAPGIEIVGVQAERYPAIHHAFHRTEPPADMVPSRATVAEGIAVKSPGKHCVPIVHQCVDDMLLVDEPTLEQAIFTLLEYEKTLVEGAGAAALAAALRHRERFSGRRIGLILSGGNIDMMVLSSVLMRGLVRSHRLVRVRVELPDVPGALGEVTRLLGELDSNIVDISHQRAFGASSVRAAMVELTLQMRGEEQAGQVSQALRDRGYVVALDEG